MSSEEKQLLQQELSHKLLQIVNLEMGHQVIKHVYSKKELGIEENNVQSPDLFIGYYKNIRSSWDTAVGAAPKDIIVKRESKWSGDHLFDASEIPGVLFINKKVHLQNPHIIDVMPTVLKQFKIQNRFFDGKLLW